MTSRVGFQMFEGTGGSTPPSTVSFTFTGPEVLLAGSNQFSIPVSLTGLYTAGKLISFNVDLLSSDVDDISIELYDPSISGTSTVVQSGTGLSGSNLTDALFYNSSLGTNPNISTGTSPYTGTWSDNSQGSPFDANFDGYDINGDWIVNVIRGGSSTGTALSFTLTFAP